MSKKSKTPEATAANASKLHRRVGTLLTELFSNYSVRQEYPVQQVNYKFKSGRERFDWVILELKVIIEVMGIQHFQPTCFGGITLDKAKRNYRKQTERDWEKRAAAVAAGWAYTTVSYQEPGIAAEALLSRISEAIEGVQLATDSQDTKFKTKIQNPKEYRWQNTKIQHPKEHQWPSGKIQSQGFKKTWNPKTDER